MTTDKEPIVPQQGGSIDTPEFAKILAELIEAALGQPGTDYPTMRKKLIAHIDARQPRPSSSEELPQDARAEFEAAIRGGIAETGYSVEYAEDVLRKGRDGENYATPWMQYRWEGYQMAYIRLARSAGAAQGVPNVEEFSEAVSQFRKATFEKDMPEMQRWQKELHRLYRLAAPTAQAGAAEGEMLLNGMTVPEFAAAELYAFQEATGCDTADEFKAKAAQQADAPAVAVPRCLSCNAPLDDQPCRGNGECEFPATLPLPSGQAEAARVALETICTTCGHDFGRHRRKDSLCPIREDGRYLGWADTVFAAPLPPANAQEREHTTLKTMQHDDGRTGWYFNGEGFYIDVEKDKDGKYSIYFRDRSDNTEGWHNQADAAPSSPIAEDVKRDAERYRWLKKAAWYIGPEYDADEAGGIVGYSNERVGDLDATIDAAIAKGEDKKGGSRG